MWEIEKFVHKGDYLYARVPNHPNANKNGYVLAHRVIMENSLGRLLTADEIVHHINHNKFDNRIENLQITTPQEHGRYHASQNGAHYVKLKCPWCGHVFIRERRYTHLVKSQQYTTCSRHCNGSFSRYIHLHGYDDKVNKGLSENVIEEFILYQNISSV